MSIVTTGPSYANGTPVPTALSRLTPRHLADLRASGLTDSTVAECGFFSIRTPDAISARLNWKRPAVGMGDALALPFFDAEGPPTGYVRLKCDKPRADKKTGKTCKYESPKGSANRAYFPPATRAALKDAAAAMLITEGEKKSAAADQNGFPCVGLVGVYGFQKKRARDANGRPVGERELIDDLASIAWQGRRGYIAYDSDVVSKPDVQRAEYHLAETLQRHGADVRIVRLPPGPAGAKQGLDDFFLAHGPAAFRALLDAATPPAKPLTPIEAADDPHRLARLYLDESCRHADGLTLRHWRDEWHTWDGAAWRVMPPGELRAAVAAHVKAELDAANLHAQREHDGDGPPPTARRVTARLVSDVAHALANLTILPGKPRPRPGSTATRHSSRRKSCLAETD